MLLDMYVCVYVEFSNAYLVNYSLHLEWDISLFRTLLNDIIDCWYQNPKDPKDQNLKV